MKIEHIALWTKDIECLKNFYTHYFQGSSKEKYTNDKKQFSSYFICFKSGARLEIMQHPLVKKEQQGNYPAGYAHIAFSVGSKEKVLELTARLQNDGYIIDSGPRMTGDNYFESCVLDPDGNKVEITI